MPTDATLAGPQPLEAASELFRRFNNANFRYCHFKSNEHLAAGLLGDTDLDILVEQRQHQQVDLALLQAGFRRFVAGYKYPSVEDYIGFDTNTGRLLHVHLHFNLVVGEKDVKGYHLGFAERLLSSREFDPANGIYVSEPHHELVLLLVRMALKLRWRNYLIALFGRPQLRGGAAREFVWLSERTDPARTEAIVADEFGAEAAAMVRGFTSAPPSIWQLRKFRSRAASALAWHRVYTPLESWFVANTRASFRRLGGLNGRYLHLPLGIRRTHHAGGCVVALLGMDGAGKSTVNAEIRRWLSWKLDVYPVYFGSGDGSASVLRWPLKIIVGALRATRIFRRLRGPRAKGAARDTLDNERRVTWAIALWSLVLALEKRTKLKRVHRARSRGMIVICDRFPQIQVKGYNDGPLLGPWLRSDSRLRQGLARWEFDIYQQAFRQGPDLVVKLDLPPKIAAGRKPEMKIEELERRRQAVQAIHFGKQCSCVEIDASAPLEHVLLEVKRAVWEQLQ
ncbi:MAG: hypothetical protein ACR2Q4_14120 [Geminicoccaceae bacterium]